MHKLIKQFGKASFGTAEIQDKTLSHDSFRELVLEAVKCGIRIFDVAPNYQNGAAELWLASALGEAIGRSGTLSPQDFMIVTKTGQLSNRAWNDRKQVSSEADWFDFNKDHIECQLRQSARIFEAFENRYVLLHNPELDSQLLDHDQLMDRCFVLSEACSKKLFCGWGISSWDGFYGTEKNLAPISLENVNASFQGAQNRPTLLQAPMGLWNLDRFQSKGQLGESSTQYVSLTDYCANNDLLLCLSACFDGGRFAPEKSDDLDIRALTRKQTMIACLKLTPNTVRIFGATRPETIEENCGVLR